MIPLITFFVAKGRGYYLAPAYPVLYAGGAVFGAELIANLRPVWRICTAVDCLGFSRDHDSFRCSVLCSDGSGSFGLGAASVYD